MRFASLFCLLFTLAGIAAAQDTNFPSGPQYLITTSSPLFIHTIATPTLSLSTPLTPQSAPFSEAVPEPTSPVAGLSANGLARIYWGPPPASEKISETVGETANGNVGENVIQNENEIEISSPQVPVVLPASFIDTGVTAMTDAQSLRVRGYGVPLGDAAAFWKTHKPHSTRIYTSADVQRLHPSS
jgi:hypothetical protein